MHHSRFSGHPLPRGRAGARRRGVRRGRRGAAEFGNLIWPISALSFGPPECRSRYSVDLISRRPRSPDEPETTPEALKKVIEKDITEVRRQYQENIKKAKTPEQKTALVRGQKEMEALLRTKLKRGRALVDSKPPRILIDPKLYAAAKAGRNIPDEGSAMMVYRRTFLEEQAHIYLHLRGVDISTEVKVSLDEMLAGVEGGGSCHHKAIPIAKNNYTLAGTR